MPSFDGEKVTFELENVVSGAYAFGKGLPGGVATPVISPEAGIYENPVEVTISAPTGASIYYTLDGSDPTDQSTLYSGAFTLSNTATVKAIAYVEGSAPSFIASSDIQILITGLEENTFSRSISMYPNPAENVVNIDFTNEKPGMINMLLTDLSGKILKSQSLNKYEHSVQFEWSLAGLSQGVYLLQVEQNNEHAIKKLLIQ